MWIGVLSVVSGDIRATHWAKAVHRGNQWNDNECLIQRVYQGGTSFTHQVFIVTSWSTFLEQGRNGTQISGLVAAYCKGYLVFIQNPWPKRWKRKKFSFNRRRRIRYGGNLTTVKLIFPFIDEICISSSQLHAWGYSVVSLEVQERVAGRGWGVCVPALEGKVSWLSQARQYLTALFWSGVVFPQECSSCPALWGEPL